MAHQSDSTGAYELAVTTGACSEPALLEIRLNQRQRPPAPSLEFLGGDFDCECWHAPAGQMRAFVFSEPDRPADDAAIAAEKLYSRLIEELQQSSYGYPLRIWNYFPAINLGQGDDERYRRFCIGRGRALEAAGLEDARMCAATAIGGDKPVMQLVALAGIEPGVSIENPRQVSSWNYPRHYGPRQPAFARATGIRLSDGRTGLLISGTASVIGHTTAHPGDTLAQTDEAARNLEALLAQAAGAFSHPAMARFNPASLARVYVRNACDWPAIRQRLKRRWPELRLCGLRGDICRHDLLVEIEAWHVAD